MRFLGVDLAWKEQNPSGVVALEGRRFPLRLVDGPRTLPGHAAVLDWLAGWVDRPGPRLATAVGIDAPLLGLAIARAAAAVRRRGLSVLRPVRMPRPTAHRRSRPRSASRPGSPALRRRESRPGRAADARPAGHPRGVPERAPGAPVRPGAQRCEEVTLQAPPLRRETGVGDAGPPALHQGLPARRGSLVRRARRPGLAGPRRHRPAGDDDRRGAQDGRGPLGCGALRGSPWRSSILRRGTMHAYAGGRAGWRGGYILAPTLAPHRRRLVRLASVRGRPRRRTAGGGPTGTPPRESRRPR